MMFNYIDVLSIKRKFARLLSALYHQANIELANITDKFTFGDYFDSLENNNIDNMLKPVDVIINDLFKAPLLGDNVQDVGPLYWSGIQYMNLFLNYSIPLRTLFLVCPLNQMVGHYNIYHEMSEIQFCDMFLKTYCQKSILKILRKERKMTVAELAALTRITVPTINYYEASNENLFNASYKNISKISKVLGVSELFFKKESDFVPVSEYLIKDIDFVKSFSRVTNGFFNLNANQLITIDPIEDVDPPYLVINNPNYLYLEKKTVILNDDLLLLLFKNALNERKASYSWESLLF